MPPQRRASAHLEPLVGGEVARFRAREPMIVSGSVVSSRGGAAAMRQVARAAAGGHAELIRSATRATRVLLDAPAARCIRMDGDEAVVVCHEPSAVVAPRLDEEELPVAALRSTGQPAVTSRPGVVSVIVPVFVGDRLWGALIADLDESAAPDPRDVASGAGMGVAEVLGAALAARRRGDLRSPAGAANDDIPGAGEFRVRLGQEVERARRHVRDLSLVLLELDHLKSVNGLRGSDVGDRFLAEFSRVLAQTARAGEVVGRLGGSEFGWILPEATAERAQRVAERLAHQMDASFATAQLGAVASGVAELSGAADGVELYEQARLALTCSRLAGDGSCTPYSGELASAVEGEGVRTIIERSRTLVGLRAMARAVDAKDSFTQRHSERVASLAGRLARRLGWTAQETRLLHQAALVHDVGKIGVPDAVLFKPGRLDDVEYDLVKAHAELGAEIVSGTLSASQTEWVRGHHERWDGRGYPDGLLGEEAPEGARILALADAWDAMTTERSYRAPRAPADAVHECHEQAGRQFWPPAVEALSALWTRGRLSGRGGNGP